MTPFIAGGERSVDKRQSVASVTDASGLFFVAGQDKAGLRGAWWGGRIMLRESHLAAGSFSESIDDLICFLGPQEAANTDFDRGDYPWRRLAYDRTLSCPDLARIINDFLSSGVEFVCNDDLPVPLCA